MEILSNYKSVYIVFRKYCDAYGGLTSLCKSPYVHISIFICLLLYRDWSNSGWWEQPLSILPNIIGFSLGSFAIIVAFGDEKFQKILARCSKKNSNSMMRSLSATFFHFILYQFIGLLLAIFGKSFSVYAQISHIKENFDFCNMQYSDLILISEVLFSFTSYFVFIYSLSLVVAATIAIFRMCGWYEQFKEHEASNNSIQKTDEPQ